MRFRLRKRPESTKLDRRRAASRAAAPERRLAFEALHGPPRTWGPGATGQTRRWQGNLYEWDERFNCWTLDVTDSLI